jgi:hypothetical protein
MRFNIFVLVFLSSIYSCSPPTSSQENPVFDTTASEVEVENPQEGGAGQKIGDLHVEWETPLSEDPEGNTVMGGNGITYFAMLGEDKFRISILDLNVKKSYLRLSFVCLAVSRFLSYLEVLNYL